MRRILFALLLCCGLSQAKIAPSFQGELLGGGRVSLKEELTKESGKALLLCFWASWCTPCMQELKTVTEKIKTDPSLPLRVLTVNVDTAETSSDVKPTLKLYQFDIRVVLDPKHEIFSKYQDANSLPFSVLIKPSGEIIRSSNGYQEDMASIVKGALK